MCQGPPLGLVQGEAVDSQSNCHWGRGWNCEAMGQQGENRLVWLTAGTYISPPKKKLRFFGSKFKLEKNPPALVISVYL